MKNLGNFILGEFASGRTTALIKEGRPAGSKNKSTLAKIDMDKIDGKDAEHNGTDGKMGSNEPVDDAALKGIDKSLMGKNEKRLLMKFKAEDDFFIVGKAGWGKTSIIKDFAKKFGYEVKTFYLDKCEAADLGGIPIAGKDDKGRPKQILLPPSFADEIAENPKKKYLLFFDEMNQAAPDVMNALMPIVLEHEIAGQKYDNFFCGAAGNFESENSAVNELSAPLKSRFKPLIVWETEDAESWKSTFRYLHKKWDDKISKKLMDEFEAQAESFENPRELEQKVIERYIWKMIEKKDNFDVDEWLDHLQRMVKDNLSRTQEADLAKLAELIFNTVKNGGKEKKEEEETGRRARKDDSMIPENIIKAVKQGMKYGYIEQKEGDKKVKYGISRENIRTIEDTSLNGEQFERLINKLEAEGIKFKFEKDSQWQEAGYKDPNAED